MMSDAYKALDNAIALIHKTVDDWFSPYASQREAVKVIEAEVAALRKRETILRALCSAYETALTEEDVDVARIQAHVLITQHDARLASSATATVEETNA